MVIHVQDVALYYQFIDYGHNMWHDARKISVTRTNI